MEGEHGDEIPDRVGAGVFTCCLHRSKSPTAFLLNRPLCMIIADRFGLGNLLGALGVLAKILGYYNTGYAFSHASLRPGYEA